MSRFFIKIIFVSALFILVPYFGISAMTISSSNSASYKQGVGLNSGLVGWWTFDGADMTATQVYDKSGQGNTGTLTTGVTKVQGKIGQALKFDGTAVNGILLATSTGAISPGSYASVSLWVKESNISATQNFYTDYGTPTNNLWSLSKAGTTFVFYLRDGTGNVLTVSTASGVVSLNKWYHIVGVVNNKTAYIYVNGVLLNSATNSSFLGANTADITNLPTIGSGQGYFTNGSLDDVRVYNRALSALEIKQIYNLGGAKINASTVGKGGSLTSGLVGHWTFDGSDTTATTALDKSGNNNTGTRIGGTSLINGKLGQALKFDGSTGYVNMGNQNMSTFTISVWINPKFVDNYRGIVSFDPTEGYPPKIVSNNGNNYFECYNGYTDDSGSVEASFGTPTLNTWQHYVCVFTPSGVSSYKNGVLVTITNKVGGKTLRSTGTSAVIGRYYTTTNNYYFNGSLDDVRIYNRALSAAEIKQLYTAGGEKIQATTVAKGGSLTSGLVGHWTFDGADTTATTVTDKSGNNNTGTRNGGTSLINGKLGQAMKFNGSTGYVNTNKTTIDFMSAATGAVSLWMNSVSNTNVTVSPRYTVPGAIGDAIGGYWEIVANNSSISVGCYDSNEHSVSAAYVQNKWYHVVWQHVNGLLYLYINGSLAGSTACGALGSTAGTIYIGSSYGAKFPGAIDDVRIYNRALSLAEIKQLYAMGK